MKKPSIFIVTILFFVFIGGHSVFAESNNSLSKNEIIDLEKEINKIVNEESTNFIQSNDDTVTTNIESITIKLDQSTLELYDYDKQKIINAFKQETKKLNEGFKNNKVEIIKDNSKEMLESKDSSGIGTQSVIDKGTYYIARVWAGVPGGGYGYINQDFRGSNVSGRLRNITLIGNSYKTGVLLSAWSHNRSWYNVHQFGITGDIYMKGTLEYIFKGSPITTAATFKKNISAYDL